MSRSDADHIKVFAGRSGQELARRICEVLDIPLGQGRTLTFPDGELLVRLDEDVRGRDCFIVQPTCHPVNNNLMELLIFIDCLRRASANRITAVIPYFGYARQDRKDTGRTPITAKLVANLITKAGADRALTMDLHAAQIQGFFDIPVDHLSAAPVMIKYFNSIRDELGEIALVSPDVGNVKVANMYANLLGGELAIIDKRRSSGTRVKAVNLVGEVADRTVLMFDDMISTAGTVCEASRIVMKHGARNVITAATHAVLSGLAGERLAESPINKVVLTNTIPFDTRVDPIKDKVVQLCVGELLANAIHRIHHNQSVSALFRMGEQTKR